MRNTLLCSLIRMTFVETCCTVCWTWYIGKTIFCLSYWALRINSSSVLCQTRDHLLSKTFHQAKHFGKTPDSNEPYLLHTCGIFSPPFLNQVLFTSIRNGVSHETLKGKETPYTAQTVNTKYQRKNVTNKSEYFQTCL